jgi:hypothetical protein
VVLASGFSPAQGVVTVNNERLEVGDGIAASDETAITIAAQTDAEIVSVATN